MLCDLQQIDKAGKTAAPSKLWSYLGERNLEELGDDDLARWQRIPASDLYVWPLPQANRGRDLTTTDGVPQSANELHDLNPTESEDS